ncbi:hypothetical protein, conserved [Leishmania tarentolae]|uniref:EF-hand domain-containing protein n=1 Tax=Leishmania tarentolae TaxID=5689 RepID=A0A640KTG7_LEITA|nr:hypothetical protein, conserved [Leishmania tarentolae]
MAPVNVERVCSVFQLFAVDAADMRGDAASYWDEIRESYIPVCFLAAAAREMGYYPTSSAIHQFTKTVPAAAAGAVTFAAFLQFCENVAHTNRPGRSVIKTMVDNLAPRGSGMMSRREFFLLLTSGSATITDGEIDATMNLLDPTKSGYIRLSDLEAVLIDSCERQRLASQSRPRESFLACATVAEKSHQSLYATDITTAAVTPQAGSSASDPQQLQRFDTARHSYSGHLPAQVEDPKKHPKWRQRTFNRRKYDTSPSLLSATATADGGRSQVQGQRWSSAAVRECASSRHACTGSAGDAVFPLHGSLCNRHETFERTQTTMTIDVDVQLSPCRPTDTVRRRKFSRNSSAAVSSSAAQTPPHPPRRAAPATAEEAAAPHDIAEDGNEPCPHHENSADARGSACRKRPQARESKHQKYAKAALDIGGRSLSPDTDSPSTTERERAVIVTMPMRKTSGSKCCTML